MNACNVLFKSTILRIRISTAVGDRAGSQGQIDTVPDSYGGSKYRIDLYLYLCLAEFKANQCFLRRHYDELGKLG